MTQPDTTTGTTIDGAAPRGDALVAGAPDIHAPGLPPGGGHVDPSPSRIVYRRRKPQPEQPVAETEPVTEVERVDPPAKSANKDVWVDYAVEHHGVSRDNAEKLSKDGLIASYGAS